MWRSRVGLDDTVGWLWGFAALAAAILCIPDSAHADKPASADALQQISDEISRTNARWIPGETSVSREAGAGEKVRVADTLTLKRRDARKISSGIVTLSQ